MIEILFEIFRTKLVHIVFFSMAAPTKPECQCSSTDFPMIPGAWEGSAVLYHGSLIRFGCMSFVFSIADG